MTTQNNGTCGDKRLLTTKEVAQMLGVTPRFLEIRRMTGGGPLFVRLSARCVRYEESDVVLWRDAKKFNSTADLLSGAAINAV